MVENSLDDRAKNGRFLPTRDSVVTIIGRSVRIVDHAGAPHINTEAHRLARGRAEAGRLVVEFNGERLHASGLVLVPGGDVVSALSFISVLINVPYAIIDTKEPPLWIDLRCCEVVDADA